MKEDDPSEKPAITPDSSGGQPAGGPAGMDRSGWSQPPAPQSPGPPGSFVDRPAAPPGPALPPGAGSPVQPGAPMSVRAPIKDTGINVMALVFLVAVVLIVVIIVAVVIAAIAHR